MTLRFRPVAEQNLPSDLGPSREPFLFQPIRSSSFLLSSVHCMSSTVSCNSRTPVCNTEDNSVADAGRQERSPKNKIDQWTVSVVEKGYLWGNIDPARAVWPLATWCFLTGYMYVVLSPRYKQELADMNSIMITPGTSSDSLRSLSGVLSKPGTLLRYVTLPPI